MSGEDPHIVGVTNIRENLHVTMPRLPRLGIYRLVRWDRPLIAWYDLGGRTEDEVRQFHN